MGKKIKSVEPKMTVMQPTVVNVDGPVENVALDGIECAHSNVDYPGRCAYHTSEFCKDMCAFNKKKNGK